ncbi:hypothetical protein E4U57_007301 [Claviceps arundinis]|nr:hypothetical protein E4U57_007301 [Claviceps arundinis]
MGPSTQSGRHPGCIQWLAPFFFSRGVGPGSPITLHSLLPVNISGSGKSKNPHPTALDFCRLPYPKYLASLKSAARFRQVSRSSQDTHGQFFFSSQSVKMVLAVDLLNPSPAAEAKKHKLKTLVPAPRSFFMDVKCPGCFAITTVFSHAQTVVICQGCTTVLCQPTGGKARLTEGCSFRRK